MDAVAQIILDGVGAKADGEVENAAAHTKPKTPAAAKKAAKKGTECKFRCEHNVGNKEFKLYYNKLNCKNFQYTTAPSKAKAEKEAKDAHIELDSIPVSGRNYE